MPPPVFLAGICKLRVQTVRGWLVLWTNIRFLSSMSAVHSATGSQATASYCSCAHQVARTPSRDRSQSVPLRFHISGSATVNTLCVWTIIVCVKGTKLSSSHDADNDAICGLRHAILNNAALLLLFVAQHSLMACKPLKDLWTTLGLSAISRLIYVFATCCTIQVGVLSSPNCGVKPEHSLNHKNSSMNMTHSIVC